MTIPRPVRELAEDPCAYTWPGGPAQRVDTDGWSLVIGDSDRSAILSRLRIDEGELAGAVEAVRDVGRAAGRGLVTWWVSDSTTPAAARERLLALGLEPAAPPLYDPTYEALALVEPPPAAPAGIDVALVTGVEELLEVGAMVAEAFGLDPTERDDRAAAEEQWAREHSGKVASWTARIEGRLVGFGRSAYGEHGVFMAGGATAPEARGRGVYRALVRVRWDDAVARGIPALTTQAGHMSAPRLRHLGFEHVADVHVLVDRL